MRQAERQRRPHVILGGARRGDQDRWIRCVGYVPPRSHASEYGPKIDPLGRQPGRPCVTNRRASGGADRGVATPAWRIGSETSATAKAPRSFDSRFEIRPSTLPLEHRRRGPGTLPDHDSRPTLEERGRRYGRCPQSGHYEGDGADGRGDHEATEPDLWQHRPLRQATLSTAATRQRRGSRIAQQVHRRVVGTNGLCKGEPGHQQHRGEPTRRIGCFTRSSISGAVRGMTRTPAGNDGKATEQQERKPLPSGCEHFQRRQVRDRRGTRRRESRQQPRVLRLRNLCCRWI